MARTNTRRSIVPGKDYDMPVAFGATPVTPLLDALARFLPIGASIQLITPIGVQVKKFLEQDGRPSRPGFFKSRIWTIHHTATPGRLSEFTHLAREHSLMRLAVWFTVVGEDGRELLEMEDTNRVLFVADAMPRAALSAILEATGVTGPGCDSASLGSVFP